jgi:hypothetical protein
VYRRTDIGGERVADINNDVAVKRRQRDRLYGSAGITNAVVRGTQICTASAGAGCRGGLSVPARYLSRHEYDIGRP